MRPRQDGLIGGVRLRNHTGDPAARHLESLEQRSERVIQIVKLGIFLVFGALLTLHGLFHEGPRPSRSVIFTLLFFARPFACSWLYSAHARMR